MKERTTCRGAARGLVALALVLMTAACGDTATHADDVEPHIVGMVTAVETGGSIQVEEDPGTPSGSAKAFVRLTHETLVRDASGRVLDAGAFQVGQRVGVWFEGQVLESYPVQATAREIVIGASASDGGAP
jgi:hypothetical protein